jgi:hypothetical protein
MASKSESTLAEASRELAAINAKLSDASARRDQLLLNGNEAELDQIETDCALLQKAHERGVARLRLLEQKAAREAAEAAAKQRDGQIASIEKLLHERDAMGLKLQKTIIEADRQFRELIKLSEAAGSAWNWPPSDKIPMLMSGATIARAVSVEVYRSGSRPALLGRPNEQIEVGFPGGTCPDHRLRGLLDQIPSLTDVLRDGTHLALRIMRGKSLVAESSDAAPPAPSGLVPTTKPPSGNGGPTNQDRISALLREQARLAEDSSPSGEAAYMEIVKQLAALQ